MHQDVVGHRRYFRVAQFRHRGHGGAVGAGVEAVESQVDEVVPSAIGRQVDRHPLDRRVHPPSRAVDRVAVLAVDPVGPFAEGQPVGRRRIGPVEEDAGLDVPLVRDHQLRTAHPGKAHGPQDQPDHEDVGENIGEDVTHRTGRV